MIDDEPVLAEAAATALFVADPECWTRIAGSMGIDDVLLLDDANVAYVAPDLARQRSYVQKSATVAVGPLSNGARRYHCRYGTTRVRME